LIGKAGLFQDVPFIGDPVAAVLRQLEGVVDGSFLFSLLKWLLTLCSQTTAFGLIDLVQSQATDLAAQRASLDRTFNNVINSYSGIAIKAKR
jgi:hypothetical protein